MKSIHQTHVIDAPIERVWQALVDPRLIEAWGGGPARMSQQPGDIFSLWGGEIHGTNITVSSPHNLDQYWYSGDWPHPSRVTFELFAENAGTRLELSHTNFPVPEEADLATGWQKYYLGPLKAFLEKAA
jgi:activator of HSP90 ATPase